MESVILAFTKEEISQKLKRMLESSGITVSGICRSKAEIMRYIEDLDAGVVITEAKLSDATARSICEDLPPGFSVMVIATASQRDLLTNSEIFVLTLPINSIELASSVNVLLKSHEKGKYKKAERKEEEKKIIEEAKLVLMERHMMTEEQAHRFIQKRSMDMGLKMIDTARMILN
ncbi:MAG: ANTAR domain-containing protein [Clostridia bacterium]|nr:ANTAR domain-containing protein [Clostridia bacterium]